MHFCTDVFEDSTWVTVWLPKEYHCQECFAFCLFSTLLALFKFHGLLNFQGKIFFITMLQIVLFIKVHEINFSRNSDWRIFVILLTCLCLLYGKYDYDFFFNFAVRKSRLIFVKLNMFFNVLSICFVYMVVLRPCKWN